jgi:hypothetical protein
MSDFKTNPHDRLTPEQFERVVQATIAESKAKAKSTTTGGGGPKTPEGKAIVAQNARKHGFAGSRLIIDDCDREAWEAHLEAYFECLQPHPGSQTECDLARRAAGAQWKIDQIDTYQSTVLELESAFQTPLINATMDTAQLEPRHYQAMAFQEQAKEPTLDLLLRYRNEAARDFDRSLRTLHRLRRERERLEELAEKKRNKLPAEPAVTTPAPQPQQERIETKPAKHVPEQQQQQQQQQQQPAQPQPPPPSPLPSPADTPVVVVHAGPRHMMETSSKLLPNPRTS